MLLQCLQVCCSHRVPRIWVSSGVVYHTASHLRSEDGRPRIVRFKPLDDFIDCLLDTWHRDVHTHQIYELIVSGFKTHRRLRSRRRVAARMDHRSV